MACAERSLRILSGPMWEKGWEEVRNVSASVIHPIAKVLRFGVTGPKPMTGSYTEETFRARGIKIYSTRIPAEL